VEWLARAAGIGLGAGVAYVAAARGRPGGTTPEVPDVSLRVKALEADVERLRLDFSDLLDRVGHLYDRIRKRLSLTAELTPQNGPAAPREPELTGKAAIRARARVGGLLK